LAAGASVFGAGASVFGAGASVFGAGASVFGAGAFASVVASAFGASTGASDLAAPSLFGGLPISADFMTFSSMAF
jgi:hypothetical protein